MGAGGLRGRGGVVSRSQQPSATTSSQQQPAAAASSTQQPAAAASSSSTQQQPTLGNGPPDILTGAHVCARSPVTHEFSTLLLQWHTPHVTPLSRRFLHVSVWRPAEQFHPVTAYYYCNPITGSELLRPPLCDGRVEQNYSAGYSADYSVVCRLLRVWSEVGVAVSVWWQVRSIHTHCQHHVRILVY